LPPTFFFFKSNDFLTGLAYFFATFNGAFAFVFFCRKFFYFFIVSFSFFLAAFFAAFCSFAF